MGVITDHLDLWGQALKGTLILFFGGGLIALVLGLIVGAMRVSPVPGARAGRRYGVPALSASSPAVIQASTSV